MCGKRKWGGALFLSFALLFSIIFSFFHSFICEALCATFYVRKVLHNAPAIIALSVAGIQF